MTNIKILRNLVTLATLSCRAAIAAHANDSKKELFIISEFLSMASALGRP
jgi:predicted transposase YbfD/YdcC